MLSGGEHTKAKSSGIAPVTTRGSSLPRSTIGCDREPGKGATDLELWAPDYPREASAHGSAVGVHFFPRHRQV